jgi:hypothetical protein
MFSDLGAESQLDVMFGITVQRPSENRDELAMFVKTIDLRAARFLDDQMIEPIMKISHSAAERIGRHELRHVHELPEICQ